MEVAAHWRISQLCSGCDPCRFATGNTKRRLQRCFARQSRNGSWRRPPVRHLAGFRRSGSGAKRQRRTPQPCRLVRLTCNCPRECASYLTWLRARRQHPKRVRSRPRFGAATENRTCRTSPCKAAGIRSTRPGGSARTGWSRQLLPQGARPDNRSASAVPAYFRSSCRRSRRRRSARPESRPIRRADG